VNVIDAGSDEDTVSRLGIEMFNGIAEKYYWMVDGEIELGGFNEGNHISYLVVEYLYVLSVE